MEIRNAPTFAITALPRLREKSEVDGHATALARKFRNLRLQAFKTAPEAFAASFEVENQRGLEHTLQRLSNAKAVHFVAFGAGRGVGDVTDEGDIRRFLETEWVGMIVLLGPEVGHSSSGVSARSDPFARITAASTVEPTSAREDGSAISTMHYHLNGVFVSPSARQSGLGRALIQAALERANADVQNAGACMTCSILVDSENIAAKALYEKAGFVGVGQETYTQQPRALVADESHAVERVALLMELVRDVSLV